MHMTKDEILQLRYGGARKNVSVSFAENFHHTLKTRASIHGLTVSAYLESLMIEQMEKEMDIESKVKARILNGKSKQSVELSKEAYAAVSGFPGMDANSAASACVLAGVNKVASQISIEETPAVAKRRSINAKSAAPQFNEAELFS